MRHTDDSTVFGQPVEGLADENADPADTSEWAIANGLDSGRGSKKPLRNDNGGAGTGKGWDGRNVPALAEAPFMKKADRHPPVQNP